ncbi:MAG: hypothetical protein IJF16_04600 [Clostridia bacterium]|nr:hypothetical protein [Clostridia bacterium]
MTNSTETAYTYNASHTYVKIEPIPASHSHVFDKEKAEDQYLASKANCTEPAKYYKSCSCGEKSIDDLDLFTYGSSLSHTEGTEWKSDKNNHWHICTAAGCGVVIESSKAAHTPDRANATATTAVKCSVCGYVITPAYGMTQIPDDDFIWYEPNGGVNVIAPTHNDNTASDKSDGYIYIDDVPASSANHVIPKTGDNDMPLLWITLLFVSGFTVAAITLLGKKKALTK